MGITGKRKKTRKAKRGESQAEGPLDLLIPCGCSSCRRTNQRWPRYYVGLFARDARDARGEEQKNGRKIVRNWISYECWLSYAQAPIDAAREKARDRVQVDDAHRKVWSPRTMKDAMHVGLRLKRRKNNDGRAICIGKDENGDSCPGLVSPGEKMCIRCAHAAQMEEVK